VPVFISSKIMYLILSSTCRNVQQQYSVAQIGLTVNILRKKLVWQADQLSSWI